MFFEKNKEAGEILASGTEVGTETGTRFLHFSLEIYLNVSVV